MELNIHSLIDDAKCYDALRKLRWGNGVFCPHCKSEDIIKRGKDDSEKYCQRYECKSCAKRFDDLTNTVFNGHHQPLKVWIICLYFMGLNLTAAQIASELSLNKDDVYNMTTILRAGIVEKKPEPSLSTQVECDEVYIVAGHKGNPAAVKKREEKAGGIG